MSVPVSPKMVQFFTRVIQARVWIAGCFLALFAVGIYGALQVRDDPAIDRLVVAADPVARATADFDRLYPEGDQALLMLEAPDPLSLRSLQAAQQIESELGRIPHVEAHSLLTLYRRANGERELDAAEIARVRAFATGTTLFRRAGLLGEHYLGVALELRVATPAERDRTLAAIDSVLRPLGSGAGPFTAIRRVGSPWLDAWLEQRTGAATARFMPLFGIFLMALVFIVYRSWRALGAIIVTLAVVVAIAVGLADLFGWSHTVISTLVPLTVMVTTTATLVYLHARYMEPDDCANPLEHHARALTNKFLPCTASMFATAVGFGALAVSDIQPVREMGLWTASGLIVAWVACFTLFPALQSLLRTPLRTERAAAGKWFPGLVQALVPATRRYRWPFVGAALALMLCGAGALFGIPGLLTPLSLQTDVLTYVNPHERVAQDTRTFQQSNGLDVIELWVQTTPGHALDPELLRGLERFTHQLESDPRITAVDGPTSTLRWERYVQSGSDRLPSAPDAWPKLAADLEQIMLTEPAARAYVDVGNLASVRISIRGRADLFGRTGAMRRYVEQTWLAVQAAEPALRSAHALAVGRGVLGTEITERLLPTLTESFAITASLIFLAFLLVFRDPSARLMTMIPSLFAILAVFLIMRLGGIALNIATILIGSTVLGATENDQIHFFYHFQEGSASGSTAEALRHAMQVAGRPILFATLINSSGFLALALSDLPPMRQFGIVSSSAFILALLADFTALPGALWILSRGKRRVLTEAS
ncbi:MAG TPA: MMPL family transporter [Steroidobacteraceae bacterium]|nr:MMPL family transporter [Steroidobacteraceae bacterium]